MIKTEINKLEVYVGIKKWLDHTDKELSECFQTRDVISKRQVVAVLLEDLDNARFGAEEFPWENL